MLEELERVLCYPRLVRASKLRAEQVTEYLEFLSASSAIVEIDETLSIPIRDPKDVHVVQTAVSGKADVISTLDGHFYEPTVLSFCEVHGINVMKDVELLQLIRGPKSQHEGP